MDREYSKPNGILALRASLTLIYLDDANQSSRHSGDRFLFTV